MGIEPASGLASFKTGLGIEPAIRLTRCKTGLGIKALNIALIST